MMQVINIDISKGWLPDFIPFGMPKGGLVTAQNLIPYEEYYSSAKNKAAYSTNTMTGTPLYGIEFRANDGTYYPFFGTGTKLYRLEVNKSLTDISKIATTYTSGTTRWYFSQYGQWVIATNFLDNPQILKGLSAANYIDLGGTPPKAKFCKIYNGILILGYLNDGVIYPQDLIWSSNTNVEDFAQSLSTGADRKTLSDAMGEITGIEIVSNILTIFHKNSITTSIYTGSPYTFNFSMNKIVNIGAIEGTIISIGTSVFFWDDREIYNFDGVNVIPIGLGVRNTILDSLDQGYLHRITTATDTRRGLIFWSYVSTASTTGRPDTIVCYNYKARRFTNIKIDHNGIFTMHKGALDMDSIDTLYPSLDAIPYQMDSNFWLANTPIIGCIDTDGSIATLSGTALSGVLETSEVYSPSNNILYTHRVRPKIQNSTDTVTVSIGSRFNEKDSVVYSSNVTVDSNGYANIRATGRYMRCKLTTGLHSGIYSIDVEGKEVGAR